MPICLKNHVGIVKFAHCQDYNQYYVVGVLFAFISVQQVYQYCILNGLEKTAQNVGIQCLII